MEKLFVPHELATQLKEKGFNEPCVAYYVKKMSGTPLRFIWEEQLVNPVLNSEDFNLAAPMYQQVVDWFRDKYKFEIQIYRTTETTTRENYGCSAEKWVGEYCEDLFNYYYKTYYEAINGAIEEALKLI